MLKWEVLVFSFHLYENGRGGRMDGRGTSYYMVMESWEKKLLEWTWSYERPQVTHLASIIKKRKKQQHVKPF